MAGATVALFGAHVDGAALMIAPDRLTRAWLGPGSASLRVAVRSVAAGREIALHSLGIVFVLAGVAGQAVARREPRRRPQ